MTEDETEQPAAAGDEAVPEEEVPALTISTAGYDLAANGRLTVNQGPMDGPRMMVLDVANRVWVPIVLAPGQWILAQPLKSKLVLPGGSHLS